MSPNIWEVIFFNCLASPPRKPERKDLHEAYLHKLNPTKCTSPRLTANRLYLYRESAAVGLYQPGTASPPAAHFTCRCPDKSRIRRPNPVGIQTAKKSSKYTGRKRIAINPTMLEKVARSFENGQITEAEAIARLGNPSRSTFYRRLWELKK